MSFVHGKNTIVRMDTGGGMVDISSYLNSFDPAFDCDTAEVTTFGKNSKIYIAGLKDGTSSGEGKWSATGDAIMNAAYGKEVDIEYGPAGDTAGMVKYEFSAICTGYNISSNNDGEVTFSLDFQHTDDITVGTWS